MYVTRTGYDFFSLWDINLTTYLTYIAAYAFQPVRILKSLHFNQSGGDMILSSTGQIKNIILISTNQNGVIIGAQGSSPNVTLLKLAIQFNPFIVKIETQIKN